MEYLSRCYLEVNGQDIADFEGFAEKEIELHKPVNLMNTTGFMKTTSRYEISVDYVIPSTGEFDWSGVADGRLTVEYENGVRETYTGVFVLKLGEKKVDGENAVKRTIDLGATAKITE